MQVVRPMVICILGMAAVASAMAIQGWQVSTLALGGLTALVTLATLVQIHRAVSALHRETQQIQQSARQAEQHYISVLQRVLRFVEVRERGLSSSRSERIGRLATELSDKLGLPADRCEQMNLAGQFHDLGMLAVSERVLLKTGKLTGSEFGPIKKHSEVSYELLRPLELFRDVLPAIRYHHERMNGTGYPAGLSGEEIPLEARILAVADAYDAMTHDRPHRPAMTPLEAMEELHRCSPEGFDPDVVQALAELMHMDCLKDVMASARGAAGGGPAPAPDGPTGPAPAPATPEKAAPVPAAPAVAGWHAGTPVGD
jgi:response regulator RpfG family c-di-GMP phosphodiesterase